MITKLLERKLRAHQCCIEICSVQYLKHFSFLVGYGDISPYTNRGRLFSMVYAVIGIPMTATLLSAMVSKWLLCIDFASARIKQSFWYTRLDPHTAQMLGTLTVITVSALIAFILPAFIFAHIESWTYFESLYFSFITMTTVGIGDFVPGCADKWFDSTTRLVYKVLLTFYFIIGLSFMLLILELSVRVSETTPSMIFSCEARVSHWKEEGSSREGLSQDESSNSK